MTLMPEQLTFVVVVVVAAVAAAGDRKPKQNSVKKGSKEALSE